MKTSFKLVVKLILIASLSVLSLACGDSDGDGVNRTPAEISSDNAETLAVEAYYGGYSDVAIPGSKSKDKNQSNYQLNLKVGDLLKNLVESNNFSIETKSKGSEKVYGNCGGEADVSYSESYPTATLTMSMHNFCEDGTTISGNLKINYSVIFVNGDYELTSMVMTFGNTLISEYGYSLIVNGTCAITFQSDTQTTATMNQTIRDKNTGIVYYYGDYDAQGTIFADRTDIVISGTYSNSIYGLVTISTPVTISVDNEGHPYTGEILIQGANDTSAVLKFLSTNTYSVECDTDGDGTYDWESGTLYW